MEKTKYNLSRTDERLGLLMIVASLIAIATIILLLLNDQHQQHERRIRSHGTDLVRELAGFDFEQLVPTANNRSVLHTLSLSQGHPDFAYAVVIDVAGNDLAQVTVNGYPLPDVATEIDPTSWSGERRLQLNDGSTDILEFHAPLFHEEQLRGFVHVGFIEPRFGLTIAHLQFIAMLALPVFLLAPLFFYLLKRELNPLRRVNQQISNILGDDSFRQIEISASGELGAFMNHFNRFIEHARGRVAELESNQAELVTSKRLLKYKKNRIERVLEALPESVLVLDNEGTISFASSKVKTVIGSAAEEIVGRRPEDWCHDKQLLDFFYRCHGKGLARYLTETVEFSPADTPEKKILAGAYPLFSPQDSSQELGTLIVFRDVTAENLAKRSRGEFIAHVAHELKSPLNVLAMYTESLQGPDGDSEEFRVEALNVFQDEVERLTALISNLLNITKIETGSLSLSRQLVKLQDMLTDTFQSVSRNSRGKDLEFSIDVPKEMSPMMIDKELLRIAVNNLLTNAIKYNRPGGSVTLSAEETDDYVLIRVKDTGIGIDTDEQQHIFDKFYRSNSDEVRAATGHGLGLALAKDIVNLHNGDIRVSSELGKGTEFMIELWKDTDAVKQVI